MTNLVQNYPTAMFSGAHACGTCQQYQQAACLGHPVIVGGAGQTCALVGTSTQCWGSDTRGQLGDGSHTQSISRVTVSNLSGALQAIAAGSQYACAIVRGDVRCWGANDHGQLGVSNAVFTEQDTPVSVTGLPGGSSGPRAQAITAGDLHSCAIVDGGAWCWGFNGNGQLGISPSTAGDYTVAKSVAGLGSGVQQIAAGSSHTCAVVNGAAQCWGDNSGGQLGIVLANGAPPPTQSTTAQAVSGLGSGVQSVVAGIHHSCALLTTGGVKCWGSNDLGQLGNAPNASSPPPQTRSDAPVNVTGMGSGVTALVAGTNHTCALLTGGTVKCWGNNAVGQLGTGTPVPSFSGFPSGVTGLTGVQSLGGGIQHTCAVGGFGVMCWGSNGSAQLGMDPNNGIFSATPVAISGVTCTGSNAALQCAAPGVL